MTHLPAEYPQWFLVTCEVIAAAVVLWLLVKIIKAAFWMAFFGALLFAVVAALSLLFR